jgi:hypothetical protein
MDLRYDISNLFDEVLSCLTSKSSVINAWLQKNRMSAKRALFIDDNPNELRDVEENSEESTVVNARDKGVVSLKTKQPHQSNEEYERVAEEDAISMAA